MSRIILQISPHPDDETLGCGPTLSRLHHHGWRIVNLACSLGRPADHHRRREELDAALGSWGFGSEVLDPPAALSASDDLHRAEERIAHEVVSRCESLRPSVVVSPQPHDLHHGHETVAAGVARALRTLRNGPFWWMWGLCSDLDLPTLYAPYGERERQAQQAALAHFAGENERNDYPALASARSISHVVLGTEKVFGFGSRKVSADPYADLLTEVRYDAGHFRLGTPRVLDPDSPVAPVSTEIVDWWIERPSTALSRMSRRHNL
jgi:LmbE family N-acetylglucosaminyl deacetylase